jgi:hypothetical protein
MMVNNCSILLRYFNPRNNRVFTAVIYHGKLLRYFCNIGSGLKLKYFTKEKILKMTEIVRILYFNVVDTLDICGSKEGSDINISKLDQAQGARRRQLGQSVATRQIFLPRHF